MKAVAWVVLSVATLLAFSIVEAVRICLTLFADEPSEGGMESSRDRKRHSNVLRKRAGSGLINRALNDDSSEMTFGSE